MVDSVVRKPLPPELLALVHHLELTQNGWWDKALQQVMLMALWIEARFVTAEEIRAYIEDNYSVVVDPERLSLQLEELLDDKAIVMTGTNLYKITEERMRSLEQDLEVGRTVENRARQLFLKEVSDLDFGIDTGESWDRFLNLCLIPLVRDMGAYTYEFITNKDHPRDRIFEYTDDFFANFERDQEDPFRQAILAFLSPNNNTVREFTLRLLDNAFFIQASGLNKENLEKLSVRLGKRASLKLFFDTNFLFSLLDLHDNPANESAQALYNLLNEISNTIPSSLYVLKITLDEFRRTLTAYKDRLQHIYGAPSLANASRHYGNLSGITLRYMRACEDARVPIDAAEFFRPYISNTLLVLRERGVELFNANTDHYSRAQNVIDDINQMWEEDWRREKTDSRYRAITHDTILRHLIDDKRLPHVESPFEAEYWVVTIDYRLLRFDRERASSENRVATCIDPSSLVRILHFWLPRTEALERAMFESLRIPFGFTGFDAKSEETTVKILATLSRFENIGDISTDIITDILMDDVTRNLIDGAQDQGQEAQIVREKLEAAEVTLQAQLDEAISVTKELKLRSTKQDEQIDQISSERERQGHAQSILRRELKSESDRRLAVEAQTAGLQEKLSKSESDKKIDDARFDYLVRWIIIPIATGSIMTTLLCILVFALDLPSAPLLAGAIAVLGVSIILGIADWRGRNLTFLECFSLYQRMRKMRKWLYGILGTLFLSLFARIIWNTINFVQ